MTDTEILVLLGARTRLSWIVLAVGFVPVVAIVLFQRMASRLAESQRKYIWITIRRWIHIFVILEIAGWWAYWDFRTIVYRFFLWSILICGIAAAHLARHWSDKRFLGLRWTASDLLPLTLWRTVSPSAALIMVTLAFDNFYQRKLVGFVWLVVAGLLHAASLVGLRSAEGFTMHKVKSGVAYKRAFLLAKEMGAPLKRVYVVPAGRGRMTNAFGGPGSIALTDNYGKFLQGAQLDFVIGHELGHVKRRHALRGILIAAAIYIGLALLALVLPRAVQTFRPVLDIVFILGPVLACYALSRSFEYAADRSAIELTQDPETGIYALASMYRTTATPANCDPLVELFMTHPSFVRRAWAIGKAGKMSPDQVSDVILDLSANGVLLD